MSDTAIATVVAGLFLAAYAAFVLAAIVQVARSTGIGRASKTAWIAGIVLVPLLGTVAWLLLGHRTARVEGAVRAARDGNVAACRRAAARDDGRCVSLEDLRRETRSGV